MIIDKEKLNKLIKKLKDDEIIIMCDNERCPRYAVTKKEDNETRESKVLLSPCPWHCGDTELSEYLDKDLKTIEGIK